MGLLVVILLQLIIELLWEQLMEILFVQLLKLIKHYRFSIKGERWRPLSSKDLYHLSRLLFQAYSKYLSFNSVLFVPSSCNGT